MSKHVDEYKAPEHDERNLRMRAETNGEDHRQRSMRLGRVAPELGEFDRVGYASIHCVASSKYGFQNR